MPGQRADFLFVDAALGERAADMMFAGGSQPRAIIAQIVHVRTIDDDRHVEPIVQPIQVRIEFGLAMVTAIGCIG